MTEDYSDARIVEWEHGAIGLTAHTLATLENYYINDINTVITLYERQPGD